MFSVKQSIKIGWEKFKAHAGICALTTLLMLALSSFSWKDDHFNPGIFLFFIAVMVLSMIVKIGFTKIFLRIYDGESPKFIDIFKEYLLFWKYLGVSILMPLAVLGGLILLIIPGIFWAVRFSLSPIIVVDTGVGPIKAMKESWVITKGNFWKLLGFWIVIILLNILGMLVLGIGLLVSVPVTTLAGIYVYRELSKAKAGLAAQKDSVPPSPQMA